MAASTVGGQRVRGGAGLSRGWFLALVALGVSVGIALGLILYTFVYAKGASYLTNNPEACANCHIMREQFDGWTRSSHHAVAVCNDCHTPHDFFGKYLTKARNGWHHSVAFTSGRFHEPIMIGERNHEITEHACRSCHGEVVHQIDTLPSGEQPMHCTRCHPNVGHLH